MKELIDAGFKIGQWQASETLIIEFAYKVTENGCVVLAQGLDATTLLEPFAAPSDTTNQVNLAFIAARYASQYDGFTVDGIGTAYTDGDGPVIDMPRADLGDALRAANILL